MLSRPAFKALRLAGSRRESMKSQGHRQSMPSMQREAWPGSARVDIDQKLRGYPWHFACAATIARMSCVALFVLFGVPRAVFSVAGREVFRKGSLLSRSLQ